MKSPDTVTTRLSAGKQVQFLPATLVLELSPAFGRVLAPPGFFPNTYAHPGVFRLHVRPAPG